MKTPFLAGLIVFFIHSAAYSQSTDIKGPVGSETFGRSTAILSNGNFVITDPLYDNGADKDVGAVYLYNGKTLALISKLTGKSAGDSIGWNGIIQLNTGNFVVRSPFWQNGAADNAGAVTFVNAGTGLNGVVDATNSVVGASKDDQVGGYSIYTTGLGNYIITSPYFDNGAAVNAGAVQFCNGSIGTTGTINASNSLVGSSSEDLVGYNGVQAVTNGNFIVLSPYWDNGADTNAGAVTWINGNSGISGAVSATNSLIGAHKNDQVGTGAYGTLIYYALANGNYLIHTTNWHSDTAARVGAVTWCKADGSTVGKVTASNSLVGSTTNDRVGLLTYWGDPGIFVLNSGNYLVITPEWSSDSVIAAGAVTWCNGATGTTGLISAQNSLVGSHDSDFVGGNNIYPGILTNGNVVVASPFWDRGNIKDVGAVTWIDQNSPTTGFVDETNSVIGSHAGDNVGNNGITTLNNGNYVIRSVYWNNDTIVQAGAVTWCYGGTKTAMTINEYNSLVGSTDGDWVGFAVTPLNNGNFVASSYFWDNGVQANAGFAAWANGTLGITGKVSSSNALVGSKANDQVGNSVRALSNGNYVLLTPAWDSGSIVNAGAATWCDGSKGLTGFITPNNSLVGSQNSDGVGQALLTLGNGNYLIASRNWDNGSIANVGAVTWCNGLTGRTGAVSPSNSMVGSSTNDNLGGSGSTSLSNGGYAIRCTGCDNGALTDAGAIFIGKPDGSTTGVISTSNALMGGTALDQVGNAIITLTGGNIVVRSPSWDNAGTVNAGALTWINPVNPPTGLVSAANSIVGTLAEDNVGGEGVSSNTTDFYFRSRNLDRPGVTNSGAVTIGNSSAGLTGALNSCNTVFGSTPLNGTSISTQFSSAFGYYIISRPFDTVVTIFRQNGQVLAQHLDAVGITISGSTPAALVTNSCRIIGLVAPTGSKPVVGKINADVWVESTQPDSFVKRHHQIKVTENSDSADARITLYFTQAEFDDYNAGHAAKLPTSESDLAGKLNLRIEKRGGISSNNTGLPSTYPGAVTTINPQEGDIIWNEALKRWEVAFITKGFSGFFVKAQATVNSMEEMEEARELTVTLYPNPTDGMFTITASEPVHAEVTVTNMVGKTVLTKTLTGAAAYELDITDQNPGIYLVKFSTGVVYKIIKN